MQITLGEKTYKTGVIKARMVRKSVELSHGIDKEKITAENLDTMVDFIVEVFNNQFTADELYDNLEAKNLLPTISKTINMVINGINSEFEAIDTKK